MEGGAEGTLGPRGVWDPGIRPHPENVPLVRALGQDGVTSGACPVSATDFLGESGRGTGHL